jgi:hypothetical protein
MSSSFFKVGLGEGYRSLYGSSRIDNAPALAVNFVVRKAFGCLDEYGLYLLRRE